MREKRVLYGQEELQSGKRKKNPRRGVMGKKSKERVPVQVLEEGWD